MNVGVIGLGEVGAGVSLCLSRAGLLTAVYDVRPEVADGLTGAPANSQSPAELARVCDIVVIAVVSAEQTIDVLSGPSGMLATARPGIVLILLSTVSIKDLNRIRSMTDLAQVGLIDSGVAAGARSAEKGIISFVGATDSDYEKALPALEAFSRYVARMGGPGAGMAAKIARNAIVIGAIRAGFEGSMLAKAAGIDVGEFVRVMEDSVDAITGTTAVTRRAADPHTDEVEAKARANMRKFMIKDLEAALEMAGDLGLHLPVVALARSEIDETMSFSQTNDKGSSGSS